MTEWTCCICGEHFDEKYHIDGRDYCKDHAKRVYRRPGAWTESVRGTIIGGNDYGTRYEFWCDGCKLAECKAYSDSEAIAWLKTNYKAEYERGCEMRAFDV